MPSLAAKSNEHPVGLVLYDYRAGKPTIPVPLSAGEFSDLLKFGAKSGSAAEFIAGAIREKIAFDAFVRRNKGEIKPSFAYLALFQPGTGERMAVAGLSEAEVDGILEAAISKGWTPSRLLDRAILMATLSGSTINQPTAQPADTRPMQATSGARLCLSFFDQVEDEHKETLQYSEADFAVLTGLAAAEGCSVAQLVDRLIREKLAAAGPPRASVVKPAGEPDPGEPALRMELGEMEIRDFDDIMKSMEKRSRATSALIDSLLNLLEQLARDRLSPSEQTAQNYRDLCKDLAQWDVQEELSDHWRSLRDSKSEGAANVVDRRAA